MSHSVQTAADLAVHLRNELSEELTERLLPYWIRTRDPMRGGFVGQITGHNEVVHDAPRGGIVNARLLWTFSAAARVTARSDYGTIADETWRYFSEHFMDAHFGGVYWMLSADGEILDDRKHIYAQAFGVYGLAEYVRFSGSAEALAQAQQLFKLIDSNAYESESASYIESFSRDWNRLEDPRLSDKDEHWPRSTNVLLHILEAYTALYRVWDSSILRSRLEELVDIFMTRVIREDGRHMHGFFDSNWTPRSGFISFGHDIEGAWLLNDAARALKDPELVDRVKAAVLPLIEAVRASGIAKNGGLMNMLKADGTIDTDHHWWPQAEAIVGLVDAFEITNDQSFLVDAERIWTFVRSTIQDGEDQEWHFRVDAEGKPYREEDKAGPWKGPYHNARACLQLMERV